MQIEINLLRDQFSALDLGEVEDVVDQFQQEMCRFFQRCNKILLLFVQWRADQQVAGTDYTIKRSAHLVTHIGQEVALGFAGCLGIFQGIVQLAAQFQDIERNAQ